MRYEFYKHHWSVARAVCELLNVCQPSILHWAWFIWYRTKKNTLSALKILVLVSLGVWYCQKHLSNLHKGPDPDSEQAKHKCLSYAGIVPETRHPVSLAWWAMGSWLSVLLSLPRFSYYVRLKLDRFLFMTRLDNYDNSRPG